MGQEQGSEGPVVGEHSQRVMGVDTPQPHSPEVVQKKSDISEWFTPVYNEVN